MRIGRKRLWALLFLAVAAAAMIVLAGSLSRLDLRPGEPFTLEKPSSGSDADLDVDEAPPSGTDFWAKVLVVMWIGMLACVPLGLVLLVVSPEARRQAATYLGPALILLVILLLPSSETEEATVLEPPVASEFPEPVAESTPAVFTATPPRWLSSFTNVALAIAATVALGGTLFLVVRRWRRPPDPLEQLAQEVQTAISAIQAGADLRDTILRCYFEMSRVLRKERGITRDEAMTPREFEAHLGDLGLPLAPIRELTRLFEGVRYGTRIPDETDEHRAIRSLSAVAEVCRSAP